uniref:Putative terminase n=1 Tax=viral metagenome TaxID=1070528 RepID=A0A6M3JQK7_9ZZZZ
MADNDAIRVMLPRPHPKQQEFILHPAKRKVIRAGRRGGKTVGVSIYGTEQFLHGHRVLYAAPTMEQVGRFWTTVIRALSGPISLGMFRKNESEHFIELQGTEQRLKAKTAWNANSLRGDYADVLILDEFQLMNEETWNTVGAPMLLDNDGDAVFIYTPPSLKSRSVSKADDPQHAAKMFKKATELMESGSDRWATFHFTSMDNPHLSRAALDEIASDMTSLAYRMEIQAEDVNEAPGALWTRKMIDDNRVLSAPDFHRVVVAVDPATTAAGDEAGVMVCGSAGDHAFLVADRTTEGSPLVWAKSAVSAYHNFNADCIVAEKNQGGEMVEITIHQVDSDVPVKLVHASRGKYVRAEPISAKAEKGLIHHVGNFPKLEDELCVVADTWVTTQYGKKPIQFVTTDDFVLTRKGFVRVVNAGCTGFVDKLVKISTRNGRNLLTTIHHPVYNKISGFVEARSLEKGNILEVNRLWRTSPLGSTNMENPLLSMDRDGLSQRMGITKIEKENCYIDLFGSTTTERFQVALMFIIRMAISSIIISRILRRRHGRDMSHITLGIGGLKKSESAFQILGRTTGKQKNLTKSFAPDAELSLRVPEQGPCFVKEFAEEDTIQSIDIIDCPSTPVFNLHTQDPHEYFANEILVHNCLWTPGDSSPNRLDAFVWGMTELMVFDPAFDPLDLEGARM